MEKVNNERKEKYVGNLSSPFIYPKLKTCTINETNVTTTSIITEMGSRIIPISMERGPSPALPNREGENSSQVYFIAVMV